MNLCTFATSLTCLASIVSLILLYTIKISESNKNLVDAQPKVGVDIRTPVIIIIALSFCMAFIFSALPKQLGALLSVLGSLALMAVSGLLIYRTTLVHKIPVTFNSQNVNVMYTMLYVTGGLGLVSGLVCGIRCLKTLTKKVKK